MKLLNALCGIYLVAASCFATTIVLVRQPALTHALEDSAVSAYQAGQSAAVAVNDQLLQPGWVQAARQAGKAIDSVKLALAPAAVKPAPARIAAAPKKPDAARAKAAPAPVRVARLERSSGALPAPQTLAVKPKLTALPPAPALKPALDAKDIASAAERSAPVAAAPVPVIPPPAGVAEGSPVPAPPVTAMLDHPTSAADLAMVEKQLRNGLTKELFANFDLFIYVSKAVHGPVAQRMYVYDKSAGDRLTLRYDWPVSTGKEDYETNPAGRRLGTHTPAGYYTLDPHRMYRHYTSHEWGVPMPYAMFFNWVHDGDLTGLAIHSTYGDQEQAALGSRASSGCVRLSPENARVLFELIHDHYAGEQVRFATNRRTGTMSNKGELARDESGNLKFIQGYRVLVVIEDFGGREVVAIM